MKKLCYYVSQIFLVLVGIAFGVFLGWVFWTAPYALLFVAVLTAIIGAAHCVETYKR